MTDRVGERVIAFGGEIDMESTAALRQLALDAAAGTSGLVCVDLTEVTFLDSTGLGLLVDIRAAATGGMITVCATRAVRTLITLTALDRVLGLRDAYEQAA